MAFRFVPALHGAAPGSRFGRLEPNQVRSILEAVENLGGTREVLRFEITSVAAPHRFECRIRGLISLLLPGGAGPSWAAWSEIEVLR